MAVGLTMMETVHGLQTLTHTTRETPPTHPHTPRPHTPTTPLALLRSARTTHPQRACTDKHTLGTRRQTVTGQHSLLLGGRPPSDSEEVDRRANVTNATLGLL